MEAPKLSVCLITYNHAAYIIQAIDSILMQKVNFSWELIIADDCSNDSSRETLLDYKKKHPDFIKLILQKKNVGASQNWSDLLEAPASKYIAYFEGDDYWTDPLKLKKKVAFLESNPAYGMVCSDYDTFNDHTKQLTKNFLQDKFNYEFEKDIDLEYYLQKRNHIRTLTVLFRTQLYRDYTKEVERSIRLSSSAGDLPMWLYFLSKAKARYFNQSYAVYRVSDNTASRLTDFEKRFNFKRGVDRIIIYFATKNNVNRNLLNTLKKNQILTEIEYYFYLGKTFEILKKNIEILLLGKRSKTAILMLIGSTNKNLKKKVINKLSLETYKVN